MNENEKVICPTCQEENENTEVYCVNCKTRLNYNSLNNSTQERKYIKPIYGEKYIDAIRWIAGLEIFCSVIMSLTMFQLSGIIALTYLIVGLIGYILLMGIYAIGRNVIDIKNTIK